MPLQTHHQNSSELPRAYGSFSVCASDFLDTSVSSPACCDWPDMIKITPQASLTSLKTARNSLANSLSPFFCQFPAPLRPATRAEADAAVQWHHCGGRSSHPASSSEILHHLWKKLTKSLSPLWDACGTLAKLKYHLAAVISHHCYSKWSATCTQSRVKDGQFIMQNTA